LTPDPPGGEIRVSCRREHAMQRFRSYSRYYKIVTRLQSLYAATIHAYTELHEHGLGRLKNEGKTSVIQLRGGKKGSSAKLRILTYHALTVYPELLRSILLVRVVSAYEVFLVDTVREISKRTLAPFKNNKKILEINHAHLISMVEKKSIGDHIINKVLRQLTNGSITDTRTYFLEHFAIDLAPPGVNFSVIDEIYDRRHLYVHNAGYVDAQYAKKYPASGFAVERLIPVDERYFAHTLEILNTSALFIKGEAEKKYPGSPNWTRNAGQVVINGTEGRLFHIEFIPNDATLIQALSDPAFVIDKGKTLADILVWQADNGERCRVVVSGSDNLVNGYIQMLYRRKDAGELVELICTKVID
jgi:hypothetical protein